MANRPIAAPPHNPPVNDAQQSPTAQNGLTWKHFTKPMTTIHMNVSKQLTPIRDTTTGSRFESKKGFMTMPSPMSSMM